MTIPLAALPQFIAPERGRYERGSVFVQSIVPGMVQIAISVSVNLLITLSATGVASWFTHPAWLATRRYFKDTLLGALALPLALQPRRAA